MRNDDFSQSGNHPTANDDYDVIPAGSGASATGNTITGRGTISGAAGADHAVGAHVTSISGAGGGDGSSMEAAGRYGSIKIDAQGNYTYTRNHGSPENVEDVFTYTLADKAGARDSARLIIRIDGKEEAKIQDGAQRIVAGNEVITLPAGVELSDIHVVGRDLVIDLPDGTQMVIVDGAVFVPQLALGDVELPADTLASLLIDSEPRPAAGPPQSSGGNFGEPVAPLDPGVPLGDLLPPTELDYTPPEFEETYIPQRPNEIDNPPIDASPITLEVDDDALPSGSNASSPDEVNSGILTFTAGTDALISFAFSTDLSHLSGALTWVRVSDTLIEGRDGGVLVISLELSAPGSIPGGTSGNVTVTATLSSNYDSHPGINADDLQSLGFIVVQAKEADGTIANGAVNVGVSDDVPHATGAEAASGIIVDETDAGTPAGFPIVRVSADSMISGAGNYGADGPAAVGALTYGLSLTGGVGSLATSLKTAAGDYPITLVQDPGNPTTITGTYNGGLVAFTLVMDPATGKLTYTQNVPLEHNTDGNTDAAYNDTDTPLSLGGLVNATVIVKDGDGDTDTASVPIGDRIVIYDDGPDAAVDQRAQFGPAILDETRGEGSDTPDGTSPNGLASTTINFSSAFLAPDFGADGAGAVNGGVSYQLILSGEDIPSGLYALEAGDTSDGDGDGYGQGDEIVLNIDGNTITGSAGGVDYFTISIDPLTGIVTFSQLNPIWHPTPGDFDELAMLMTESASDIVVRQTVTDADGDFDTADLNIGQGVFGIQDDGPDPFDGCPDEVIAINDVGSTFTGDLHLPDVGEDKPGVVTFNVMDGDPVLDTGGNPVSSSGGDLYYFINAEGVLEARAGGESGDVIFTITLNGDGTYTYDQLGDITSETELSITDLSSVGGGNVAAKAIDVEGSPFDLILSTKAGTTVNTNATEIGIGAGNSFESGEILRVDLVQNAFVTGSGGGAVLNFGEYYSANSYKQDVSGLGGAQKASFTVKVIAVHEAPGSNAADPADGDNVFYGDTNDTFVTGTTLHLYNGSGVLVDPANYAGLGITVTALADGWQIAGLPNNYDFQIVSTTAFNAIQIEAIAGTDTFKLGFIDITSTVQSNVDLQVPIALTDADGDSVTCDIDVHLGPPTNVPAVVATVNEAGLDGIGSDGASNSEITSGELSLVVSGGTGPYTYAIVGSGDGTYGTLTIDPVTGHYQYVLDTPFDSMPDANNGTNTVPAADVFTYSVTDANGVVTQAQISINVVDDVPTANDDVAGLTEGGPSFVTFDVDTNDVPGADGTGSRVFTSLTGTYGNITLNPDGTQTYTLTAAGQLAIDALAPGATLTDSFTYNLTDGDGDVDPATVTITLTGTDDPVTITNLTPKANGGDAIVDEDDLLASRGVGESAGSDPTKESTTVTGDFNISAPDGLNALVIDGHTVISGGVFTAMSWTTPLGNTISITAFDAASGKVSYSYTLLDNEAHPNANGENSIFDDLNVHLSDVDGSTADSTLSIQIVDDVPTANDDAYEILEGDSDNAITLNVKANDVSGADGTGLPSFTSLTGIYGNIVVNSEGQQTYTLNATGIAAINALAPGATLTDTFTYKLTDGDGDTDPATVTITLKGTDDPVTITNLTPKANGGDAIVDEDDLLASRGVGESAGSDPTKESTTVTGDFNISAPDGLNALVIDGHTVISGGVFTAMSWTTPLGNTISITAFDAASGKVSYSYTLLDNEAHPNANGENSIFDDLNVHLSDVDGSTADSTLSIQIVDDVPTANDDAYEILEGDSDNAITLNVKANDVSGADGTGLPSFTSLTGIYGNIVVNSEGQQTYTLNATGIAAINALAPGATLTDTFTYKLTDGDGDTDPATVTITLKGTDDPVTITNLTPKANGGDAIVDEDDLLASRGVGESAGSDPTKESTTVTGDFNISAPDGLNALVIDGHTVISGGVFTAMSWTTPLGNTISITAFDAASGKVSYSYTLLDNEAHPNANGENSIFDDLNVHLSDVDGSTADSTLSIQIVDDVPTANDDAYEILEGDSDNAITLNVKANDVSGADGTGLPSFTSLTGIYGNIVVNSEGQQTYTLNATGIAAINALAPGATLTDTFTYKLTDGDGDTDPATVTITLKGTDDPVTITNLTPKANGGDAIVDEDDLLASRGVGESAGSDPTKESTTVTGDFNISAPDGLNALVIDGHTVISGGVFTAMSWTTPLGNTISITAFDAASGKVSYSYTLLDNEAHPNANGENSIFDDLNVHLSDVDGSTADSTLSIQIVDDVPGQSASQIVINLDEDELPGGITDGDSEGQSASGSLTSLVVMGADGLGSFAFDATAVAGLPALTSGSQAVTWAVVGTQLVAYTGANSADASKYVLTISLTAGGNYTVTLLKPLDHVAGAPLLQGSGDDQDMTIDVSGVIKFTDADGDSVNLDANSLLIKVEDDIPTTFTPQAAVTTNNAAGLFNGALDFGDAAGLTNNYGADGGKAVFTLTGLPSSQTSGGVPLFYTLSNGDQTLTATAGNGGPVVYTAIITGSTYTLDIVQPIDSLTTVDFINGAYDHPGGNPDYYAFFLTGNNDSSDLLLTPASGGTTVNLNSNLFGIGAGNSMDPGDAVRLDYVTDLVPTGTSVGQYTYEHHYNVNGATVGIAKANSATARFTAYDDPDGNNTVGDGAKDTINQVSLKYGAGSLTVVPTTTNTAYVVGGHTFWVLLNADGSVSVGGLAGDATGSVQSTVGIYTASGYNSLVVAYENGPHGDDTFKIGGFGAAVPNTDPVIFDIPVKIVDNDGDSVAGSPIHVTLNTPAPPVVLDTNHDGQIGFLGIDHGVLYDMNGDGHLDHTAWVAPGDSILFFDADGNGTVSGASEFVFGYGNLTDLAALHAMYGDQLDANDADFTMFALWNDANSNGIVDAGEIQTLAEAGITSISLVSDGVGSSEAGGDVAVSGSGSFTYVNDNGDLANGKLADASLGYRPVTAEEEQRLASTSTNSSLLAIAAAAAALADQAAASTPSGDDDASGPADPQVNVAPTATPATQSDEDAAVSPLVADNDSHVVEAAPAAHHNAVVAEESNVVIDSSAHEDAGPSDLPQGSDLPAVDSTPLVDVAPLTVAAEAVAPDVGDKGGAHQNAVTAADVIEHSGDLVSEALARFGGNDPIESLAQVQSGPKAVQGWDMADFGHLPAGVMEHIGAEASLLHPDAVQPVMHG